MLPIHLLLMRSSFKDWTLAQNQATHLGGVVLRYRHKNTKEISYTVEHSQGLDIVGTLPVLSRVASFEEAFGLLQKSLDVPKALSYRHALMCLLIEHGHYGVWEFFFEDDRFELQSLTNPREEIMISDDLRQTLAPLQHLFVPRSATSIRCFFGEGELSVPQASHARLEILTQDRMF